MSHDDALRELIFLNTGRKYCLTKMRHFHNVSHSTGSMRQIHPSAINGLIYFRQLIQPVSLAELKKLLARGDHHLNSRDDEAIRMRIAALIVEGTLGVFETVTHISAPHENLASSVTKHRIIYDDVDHRQMQSSADLIIYQERSPKPVASQKNETIDEQAQVAVLIAAAEHGTPLCELCKR